VELRTEREAGWAVRVALVAQAGPRKSGGRVKGRSAFRAGGLRGHKRQRRHQSGLRALEAHDHDGACAGANPATAPRHVSL